MDLTPQQSSEVVYAFLKAGVPPTAVARAMGMDVEHIAAAQSQMRVEKYGTDELNEAMVGLIWMAVEEVHRQIAHGSPANRARFVQIALSRSIGLAGKSSPELAQKVRDALSEMAADMAPEIRLGDSIYTPTE